MPPLQMHLAKPCLCPPLHSNEASSLHAPAALPTLPNLHASLPWTCSCMPRTDRRRGAPSLCRVHAADGCHDAHGCTRRMPPCPINARVPLLPFPCPNDHLDPLYPLDMPAGSRVHCTCLETTPPAAIAADALHGHQTITIDPVSLLMCQDHPDDRHEPPHHPTPSPWTIAHRSHVDTVAFS